MNNKDGQSRSPHHRAVTSAPSARDRTTHWSGIVAGLTGLFRRREIESAQSHKRLRLRRTRVIMYWSLLATTLPLLCFTMDVVAVIA